MEDSPASCPEELLRSRCAALLRQPVCDLLREILGRRPGHLVGGVLRDLALGRQPRDLDVIVAGEGAAVAAKLAEELGTRSIELGGRRFAAYRVPHGESPIDLWDRGAAGLWADLRRRDFTIHSWALDLHTGAIDDPFSGVEDLTTQRLRMTTAGSFIDDPLRALRLCRFAAHLERFEIDPATLARAGESVARLDTVSSERIRTEIDLTLGEARMEIAAQLWVGLLILPEQLLHSSLNPRQRRYLESALPDLFAALGLTAARLPVFGDLSIIRLALVLTQIGRVMNQDSLEDLDRLREQGYVTRARAQQVARLLDSGPLPTRESQQRWYLHRLGDLWPQAVCYAATLAPSPLQGELPSADLTRVVALATERAEEIFDPDPLVTGEDLQLELGTRPGPHMGRTLARIRREQIEGTITTRAEALVLASQLGE